MGRVRKALVEAAVRPRRALGRQLSMQRASIPCRRRARCASSVGPTMTKILWVPATVAFNLGPCRRRNSSVCLLSRDRTRSASTFRRCQESATPACALIPGWAISGFGLLPKQADVSEQASALECLQSRFLDHRCRQHGVSYRYGSCVRRRANHTGSDAYAKPVDQFGTTASDAALDGPDRDCANVGRSARWRGACQARMRA